MMKHETPARKWLNPVTWIAVVTMVVLTGFYVFGGNSSKAEKVDAADTPALSAGDQASAAPAFTLPDLNGKSVSLADFRGKGVVLNFWATWCPPCKKEIPDFIDLQKEYGSKGVVIVGIALDQKDKVQAFVEKNGMNYPVLLGDEAITVKYGGIQGIPTTFIIDKKGNILNRFEGYRPRTVWESEIKKLL